MCFVPNAVGRSGDDATPGKYYNLYRNLSLETVFPALKLTQNSYVNMNTTFS